MFLSQIVLFCGLLHLGLGWGWMSLQSECTCCTDELEELRKMQKTLTDILEEVSGPSTTESGVTTEATESPPTIEPTPEIPPGPVPDISVVCGSKWNTAIGDAIGQTFYPPRSGPIDKISIWIEPDLYYTTEYKLQVFRGIPGSTLLGESSGSLILPSLQSGGVEQFYDFAFSPETDIEFSAGNEYSWKLVRLSQYSGEFRRCPDSIEGIGYWVGSYPKPDKDYSFLLYILA